MNEPIVLLLEDWEHDGERVSELLWMLEEMKIISVRFENKNTLDFGASDEEMPSVLLMYLNRTEYYAISFLENAYIIQFQQFGLKVLEREFNCTICPAGTEDRISILDFLSSVCASSGPLSCTAN